MGYACPVCERPQRDADHLAFTAMVRVDDSEEWLDDHAPGWAEAGTDELAPRVVEHAPDADYGEVFEDTAGRGGDRRSPSEGDGDAGGDAAGRAPPEASPDPDLDAAGARGAGSFDAEARAAVEAAREMTRAMLAEGGSDDDDGDDSGAAGDDKA